MVTKLDEIKGALQGPGPHLGDIVWMSLADVNVSRAELRDRYKANGLPETLCPADPSAEAGFGAAVSAFKERGGAFFLRRVERGKRSGDVLLIEHQTVEVLAPTLTDPHATKIESEKFVTMAQIGIDDASSTLRIAKSADWKPEAMAVFNALSLAFDTHMNTMPASELSATLVRTLLGWCGGIRLRERGNLYWCHASGQEQVRGLLSVVNGIGDSYLALVPVHDSSEARKSVARAARESFEGELAAVHAELRDFASTTPRASTLQRRLDEYEELRARVDLYADILEAQKDSLAARLDEATAKVKSMLAVDDVAEAV